MGISFSLLRGRSRTACTAATPLALPPFSSPAPWDSTFVAPGRAAPSAATTIFAGGGVLTTAFWCFGTTSDEVVSSAPACFAVVPGSGRRAAGVASVVPALAFVFVIVTPLAFPGAAAAGAFALENVKAGGGLALLSDVVETLALGLDVSSAGPGAGASAAMVVALDDEVEAAGLVQYLSLTHCAVLERETTVVLLDLSLSNF